MSNSLIKNFTHLCKNDVKIAGGKGASLGEMTKAKIQVPNGFVILSAAFDNFIETTGLNVKINELLEGLNTKEINQIENASKKIQTLILAQEIPPTFKKEILNNYKVLNSKFVAVRSSATLEDSASAAWAGQLDSYLNTTKKELLNNIKKCWASLFTPRAIFYRFEKKLHKDKISVAVIIQKMIDSEQSGVAFSVHPVTQNKNQILIEAGFGLGEAIVSGSITPDSYVINKKLLKIINININEQKKGLYKKATGGNEWKILEKKGKKQALTKTEIIELSKLILQIESHYGFPCDIEWAKEKGKFYILQSRPITTLKEREISKEKWKYKKIVTRDLPLILVEGLIYAMNNIYQNLTGKPLNFPSMIIYSKNYIIEEWMDEKFEKDLVELVYKKNIEDENFFEKYVDNYKKHLEKYSKINSFERLNEFKEYIGSLHKALEGFIVFYLIAGDDRNNKNTLKKAREIRDKDTLGDDSDRIIRDSLVKIFPYTKNYEAVISKEDLENIPTQKILEKRGENFIFAPPIFIGNASLEDFEKNHPNYEFNVVKVETKLSTLKGDIASKGKVKGKIRIIFRKKDINQLKEGEVLVSPMTTPYFVPAMKKASAIITDEGGITCHAAIVSRELKKPCITGTKFATEILKNGDLVEVDANKGIVRILNKNNDNDILRNDNNNISSNNHNTFESKPITTIVNQFKEAVGKSNLIVLRGNFIPLFLMTYWLRFYDKDFKTKRDVYPVLSIKKDDLFISYINLDKYLDVSREGIQRYIEKVDFINQINVRYKKIKGKIEILYEKYMKEENFEENKLLHTLKEAEENLHEVVALTLFIDFLDSKIIEEVFIKNKFKINFEKAYEVSSVYDFPSFDLKNNIEILKWHKQNKNYLKYVYTGYSSCINDEDINNKLSKINFKELKTEVFKTKSQLLIKRKEKNKLRSKLNKEDKFVADFLSWISELRDDRKILMNKMNALFYETTYHLYQNWGIDLKFVKNSYIFEILKGKKYVLNNINTLTARENDFINLYYGKEDYLEKYDNLEQEFEDAKLLEEPRTKTKKITGQIANKGIVRGFAKIIFNPNKNHSFMQGEILITSMTRPEFVPIMKKASAIVTNEGGITCHAAIISRELNIPCIIGTKNATEIIHDGDFIEVDAIKGIVIILDNNRKENKNIANNNKKNNQ